MFHRSMRVVTLGLLALLLAGAPAPSQAQDVPSHEPFTQLLQEIVVSPLVDYEVLMERRALLDRYVASLGQTDPERLEAAPRDEQLAFRLNAYNACMLQLVADHYPIERGGVGIGQRLRNMAASRPDNSVWWIRDVFDGEFCLVTGERWSLDEIEHEIIRPVFQEPRIHFAVNCAAYDCPQLREEAYVGDRLDEQLDDQVRRLMAVDRHFRIEDGDPPVLRVNQVLDWFSEDFGGEDGITDFFAPYVMSNGKLFLYVEEPHPGPSFDLSTLADNGEDPDGVGRRVVRPFAPGSPEVDRPVRFREGEDVVIEMVGNSCVPKVVEIPAGTEVTWVNEDVFDYLHFEQTGLHNSVRVEGPADFAMDLLEHGQSEAVTFTEPGEYTCACVMHP